MEATSTRTRSARGEGDQLREVLLGAATELLAEVRDVEKLSVRAVTRRAGVSPTALYLHFADKAALTLAIKDRGFPQLLERLREAGAQAGEDPSRALQAMGEAYLRFAHEQPALYGVLFGTFIPRSGVPVEDHGDGLGPGERVFAELLSAVGRCLGSGGTPSTAQASAREGLVFEEATVLWLALHGRTSIARAMPSFPFPADADFSARLVARLTPSSET